MAVKNFFSGVEGNHHFGQCVSAGARHVLTSYLHLRKGDKDIVKRRKNKHPEINFLVDSGAHTLQVSTGKPPYSLWGPKEYEDYCREYAKWLEDNREYVFAGVELDIDYCVGVAKVEDWQRRLFEPLEEKGLPICYVWHKERGIEGWEEMCSRFSYVGLPGEMSSDPDFNKYMTVARRYCTKVHGFAATKQADFRDWPWYSIDSITWKTSEIYGTLIVWDEHAQTLKFEQDKSKRANYRKILQSMGFDAESIIRDTDYKEVTRFALTSMSRMESFYARKYADRVFYYEMRLPMPAVIKRWKPKRVMRWWDKMNPAKNFQKHEEETNVEVMRQALVAISAVQNHRERLIRDTQPIQDFLAVYFRNLIEPNLADLQVFQKEMASHIAPPNPPPLQRVDPSHWISMNNPPKERGPDALNFAISDLEHTPELVPIALAEIE